MLLERRYYCSQIHFDRIKNRDYLIDYCIVEIEKLEYF